MIEFLEKPLNDNYCDEMSDECYEWADMIDDKIKELGLSAICKKGGVNGMEFIDYSDGWFDDADNFYWLLEQCFEQNLEYVQAKIKEMNMHNVADFLQISANDIINNYEAVQELAERYYDLCEYAKDLIKL